MSSYSLSTIVKGAEGDGCDEGQLGERAVAHVGRSKGQKKRPGAIGEALPWAVLEEATMVTTISDVCPVDAPLYGFLGIASALVFSCLGAAYGTARVGVGLFALGVEKPDLLMKGILPIVMAGMIGIYGLIVGILINTGST